MVRVDARVFERVAHGFDPFAQDGERLGVALRKAVGGGTRQIDGPPVGGMRGGVVHLLASEKLAHHAGLG